MVSSQQEELKLSSDPKNVARVETFVERLAKKYAISPNVYGNVLISLTEAVTNAITHGNGSDSTKSVLLRFDHKPNSLAFVVSDQGPGFDFENLPDPTSPENLLRIGGRGVFLMKQLSDGVKFYNDGRTVEITFNI